MQQQPRRSCRITKKPVRYEPVEQVTDDFDNDEYSSDSDDSNSECDSVVTESTYLSDDEDEHTEQGNLKGFVVESDEESESESEPEPEPKKKRKYVRKNKNAIKDRDINIDI
jgi:hypothetical protein